MQGALDPKRASSASSCFPIAISTCQPLDAVMDDAAAAAVGELEGMIIKSLTRVQRNTHEARLRNCVIGDEAVDAVRQQNAQAVARHKTPFEKRVAQSVR